MFSNIFSHIFRPFRGIHIHQRYNNIVNHHLEQRQANIEGLEEIFNNIRENIEQANQNPLPHTEQIHITENAPTIQAIDQISRSQLQVNVPAIGTPAVYPLVVYTTANPPAIIQAPIPLEAPVGNPIKISDLAKKMLNQNNALASSFFAFGVGTTVQNPTVKGFLSFAPFFLYSIYASKEKVLQNINVSIVATNKPKTYEIGFGKKNNSTVIIPFKIQSGNAISAPYVKTGVKINSIPSVFNTGFFSQMSLSKLCSEMLLNAIFPPALLKYVWKRQEITTFCNITIDDPGNPRLKNGPLKSFIPLNKFEGFTLIYRDPTYVNPLEMNRTDNYIMDDESLNYSEFRTWDIKITEPISSKERHRSETISLPFLNDPQNSDEYHLKVTQY